MINLAGLVVQNKATKTKKSSATHLNIIALGLLSFYVPLNLVLANNYWLNIRSGSFNYIQAFAVLVPFLLLAVWYKQLGDLDHSVKQNRYLYALPAASTLGLYFVNGIAEFILPFIVIHLLIIVLINANINKYIRWLFIFLILNYRINWAICALDGFAFFNHINRSRSLYYRYYYIDIGVLIIMFLCTRLDRIYALIKHNYSKRTMLLTVSLGLVALAMLFDFIMYANANLFVMAINKIIMTNGLNIKALTVPSIGYIVMILQFILLAGIYYYLTERKLLSGRNVMLCLIPYYLYAVFF